MSGFWFVRVAAAAGVGVVAVGGVLLRPVAYLVWWAVTLAVTAQVVGQWARGVVRKPDWEGPWVTVRMIGSATGVLVCIVTFVWYSQKVSGIVAAGASADPEAAGRADNAAAALSLMGAAMGVIVAGRLRSLISVLVGEEGPRWPLRWRQCAAFGLFAAIIAAAAVALRVAGSSFQGVDYGILFAMFAVCLGPLMRDGSWGVRVAAVIAAAAVVVAVAGLLVVAVT